MTTFGRALMLAPPTIALALSACGSSGGDDTGEAATTAEPDRHTLTVDVSIFWPQGGLDCPETPLKDDQDMIVRDENDATIAVVSFSRGLNIEGRCRWLGEADVPDAAFYTVAAASGQVFDTLSRDDLDAADWTVEVRP